MVLSAIRLIVVNVYLNNGMCFSNFFLRLFLSSFRSFLFYLACYVLPVHGSSRSLFSCFQDFRCINTNTHSLSNDYKSIHRSSENIEILKFKVMSWVRTERKWEFFKMWKWTATTTTPRFHFSLNVVLDEANLFLSVWKVSFRNMAIFHIEK